MTTVRPAPRPPTYQTVPVRGGVVPVLLLAAAGVLAVTAVVALTASGTPSAALGLPDAGPVTAYGLPLAQLAHEVAEVIVVGLLFVRCLLGREMPALRAALGVLAARWSWAWAGATACWIVFTLSDLLAVPVATLPWNLDRIAAVAGTDRVLSETATLWIALAVALFAARTAAPAFGLALVCLAAAGLLPTALTGHAGHHGADGTTTALLAVHVVAAALWVGGLVAIIVRVRPVQGGLPLVLGRFSRAALLCAAAVAVTGVVGAVATLDGWSSLWSTDRGRLVLAKTAGLALLVACGHLHRSRTVPAALAGRSGPLRRLALVEIGLMGGVLGLAVGLSLTG